MLIYTNHINNLERELNHDNNNSRINMLKSLKKHNKKK
jgi:hypothetical protein